MIFMDWDEKFSVNIEEIDAHHKQLFILLNDLYENVLKCEDLDEERELTQQILHKFSEYAKYHFATEEKLMIEFNYPQYIAHKQQHDVYLGEVEKMEIQHKQGAVALSFTAFSFLKEWISTHILGDDKRYEDFFRKHGIH